MTTNLSEETRFTMDADGHVFRVVVKHESARTWAWRANATDGWKLMSGVTVAAETLEDALARVRRDVRHLAQECTRRGE